MEFTFNLWWNSTIKKIISKLISGACCVSSPPQQKAQNPNCDWLNWEPEEVWWELFMGLTRKSFIKQRVVGRLKPRVTQTRRGPLVCLPHPSNQFGWQWHTFYINHRNPLPSPRRVCVAYVGPTIHPVQKDFTWWNRSCGSPLNEHGISSASLPLVTFEWAKWIGSARNNCAVAGWVNEVKELRYVVFGQLSTRRLHCSSLCVAYSKIL